MRHKKELFEIAFVAILLVAFLAAYEAIKDWLYIVMEKGYMQAVNDTNLNIPLLTWQHVKMSFVGCLASLVIGLSLGIFATIGVGRQFKPLIERTVTLSNALPPLGLVAIFIPLLGYGIWSGAVVLVLCGTVPIVFNTIAGLDNVPPEMVEIGEGLGMNKFELFMKVKFPFAFPVLVTGMRSTCIIIIGIATLAAISGAGGLGIPIFESGIRGFDPVMLIEGAVPVCLLALLVDRIFNYAEVLLLEKFAIVDASK